MGLNFRFGNKGSLIVGEISPDLSDPPVSTTVCWVCLAGGAALKFEGFDALADFPVFLTVHVFPVLQTIGTSQRSFGTCQGHTGFRRCPQCLSGKLAGTCWQRVAGVACGVVCCAWWSVFVRHWYLCCSRKSPVKLLGGFDVSGVSFFFSVK